MRKKNSILLSRIIQWISGGIALIVIYPIFGLIYPCWRRIRGTGNLKKTGVLHARGPLRPHREPTGKSIPQGK